MMLFKYGFKRKYVCRTTQKFFCEDLHVRLAANLFCLKTLMVYSIHTYTRLLQFQQLSCYKLVATRYVHSNKVVATLLQQSGYFPMGYILLTMVYMQIQGYKETRHRVIKNDRHVGKVHREIHRYQK